jgi:hypothetical protein
MRVWTSLRHYSRAIIQGIRHGRLIPVIQRYWNFRRADRAIANRLGLQVLAGPFAGMNYFRTPPGHHFSPKILGIYEKELHGSVESIFARQYDRVMNVGSAEGYYAVGFGRHFGSAQIFAYDISKREQALCAQLGQLNGLAERLHVSGECTSATLDENVRIGTLVVMDCEGCEEALLNPELSPNLVYADCLVEIHEAEGITILLEILKTRFAQTHDQQIIWSEKRNPDKYPELAFITDATVRYHAVVEREPRQAWLVMFAKAASSR